MSIIIVNNYFDNRYGNNAKLIAFGINGDVNNNEESK